MTSGTVAFLWALKHASNCEITGASCKCATKQAFYASHLYFWKACVWIGGDWVGWDETSTPTMFIDQYVWLQLPVG